MPGKAISRSTFQWIKKNIKKLSGRVPKRGPDFFIIGATRAGSTHLHSMLAQHPDVFMPRIKELHYFDHDANYRKDLYRYHDLFFGYNGEGHIGEATPMYMEKGLIYNKDGSLNFNHSDSAIARINEHFPQAKLVISLRDPVKRMLSMYKKSYGQGKAKQTFKEEIYKEFSGQPNYHFMGRNRYDIHLDNIYRYFAADQVKILIFEEWIKNPDKAFHEIAEFIGFDHNDVMIDAKAASQNASGKYYKSYSRAHIEEMAAIDAELNSIISEELAPAQSYVEQLLQRKIPWTLVE